ncbi:MAG: diguanylate cyclase [Myxococcota bacterium]|jgi:two-component system, cell cycle response regulator|nr:diguanylate cyclase [Myxococcota bacterium]
MAVMLLVDDSPTIRNQIRGVLEGTGEFSRFLEADDGLHAFKLLAEHKPDVVVCDLVMPVFDGMKFLALRGTRPELSHIPVIMLTAEQDSERKAEILDRGASDYVTKPFNDKELLARVRVHLRVKVLQDQLREANLRLENLAVTDGLTGLFNRRHFDSLLVGELQRSLRYKVPVSVVLVDIDHFKQVNDTYGHSTGDQVLRNLSRVVAGGVRTTDFVARFGGEELAVILTQTPLQGAFEVAERLRATVAAAPHDYQGKAIFKTASFGVACYDGQGAPVSPEELLGRADQALYRAKHEGRNRVISWDPTLAEAV